MLPAFATSSSIISAQEKFVPNYDEAKIPKFTLPDPLVTESGQQVTDAATWNKVRRPELLELFRQQVYGRAPAPCQISYKLVSSKEDALGGKATRREIDVFFGPDESAHVDAFVGLHPEDF